jgi:hypothetical protein
VDEAHTSWKTRFSFKPYLPIKSAKYCKKSLMYYVNPGKDIYGLSWCTQAKSHLFNHEINKTASIIVHVVEHMLGEDHSAWPENIYDFPALARLLNTSCVGTLK